MQSVQVLGIFRSSAEAQVEVANDIVFAFSTTLVTSDISPCFWPTTDPTLTPTLDLPLRPRVPPLRLLQHQQ